MLRLAVIFIVIALIAAFFGLWSGQLLMGRAKILVFVFLVLAVLSFFGGMFRRKSI